MWSTKRGLPVKAVVAEAGGRAAGAEDDREAASVVVAGGQGAAVEAGQGAVVEADREAAVAVRVAEAGTATAAIVAAEAAAAGSRLVTKSLGMQNECARGVSQTPRFILGQLNCDKLG